MTNNSIGRGLNAYSTWRSALTSSIASLQSWLDRESLSNNEHKEKLGKILNHVKDDNLYVSFVSEYSRGKTELINTLFFSDYKKRVLPSGIGRTTMCPTEIFYKNDQPLGLSLLPIETSSSSKSVNELKSDFNGWEHFPIDINKPTETVEAFKHLQDVIQVPKKIAESLGFSEASSTAPNSPNDDDMIEIPKWRHALVNIKNPLLEQKLVVLDTPGFNAMGAETKLTTNQLPKSHSIIFVLDNSTGVSQSDFDLWSKHIEMENNASRIIAINKIDTLWDSIKSTKEVNNEIDKQVSCTAKRLNVASSNIYPVSAKMGLIGKIHNRKSMIKQSRVNEFEKAIAHTLIPSKKKITLTNIFPLAQSIAQDIDNVIKKRCDALASHNKLTCNALSKNLDLLQRIKKDLNSESDLLLNLSEHHSYIDSSFARHIKEIRRLLDIHSLQSNEANSKSEFKTKASVEEKRNVLLSYIRKANQNMHLAVLRATEIEETCGSIMKNDHFNSGVNITFRRLELDRHLSTLNNIEQTFLDLKLGKGLSKKRQENRIKKAFDSCSLATYRTFKRALNETNDWVYTLMSPLETRIRNQSKSLNDYKQSIVQISRLNKELKLKIESNHARQETAKKQKNQLYALVHNINKNLIHSGYTEEDLYKPTKQSSDNVVKMKPSAS